MKAKRSAATARINKYGSIELKFSDAAPPSEALKQRLVAADFWWSGKRRVWWQKGAPTRAGEALAVSVAGAIK